MATIFGSRNQKKSFTNIAEELGNSFLMIGNLK
jgi:hypothetical protein